MTAPTASIVITNYNYGRFLARCIDSALAQSYAGIDVVVVDDVSQDNSRDIIASYGDRIVPVLQARNGGQGAAFNAGFRACRGDVVFFLDADDWLYPKAVERVLAHMAAGVAQAQFRLHLVDRHGRRIDLLPPPEVKFDAGDVVPILLSRGRYQNTVTSGNAFARSALAAVLPVPEDRFRISADGYLVTVAPLCGTVIALDEPLGAYAVHGANNWAGGAGRVAEPAKLRRAIGHDFDRYDALRECASRRGLMVAAQPGLADPQHLTSRIGSLIRDRQHHPVPQDRRLSLAMRGVLASGHANLPAVRRAVLAAWFAALGILPRPWAEKIFLWKLDPASRPARVQRAMSAVRRGLQPRRGDA